MSERNDALDFTKGSLVLFMVLYHWLNYFVILQWDVYRYLRFLTPSFILITGFIVSNVYLSRRGGPDYRVYSRLIVRGAKILLLFTALNLLVSLVMPQNYNGADLGVRAFIANAYSVYVTGNGRAIFDVLVPIGYFLVLAPLVIHLSTRVGGSLNVVCGLALAAALATSAAGSSSVNLELLSIALLGMARIHRTLDRPMLLVVAYLAYLAAVTYWDVLFPLQVVGVCLTLLLIYLAGVRFGNTGAVQRLVIELGKYSLFAYIAQVACLQLLRRGLRNVTLHGGEQLLTFLAALTLTVAGVVIVAAMRSRSTAVDRVYRAVFA